MVRPTTVNGPFAMKVQASSQSITFYTTEGRLTHLCVKCIDDGADPEGLRANSISMLKRKSGDIVDKSCASSPNTDTDKSGFLKSDSTHEKKKPKSEADVQKLRMSDFLWYGFVILHF